MQLEGQSPDSEGTKPNKDSNSELRASDLRPDVSFDIHERYVIHSPLFRHGFAEALHGRILHGREGRGENITDADSEQ